MDATATSAACAAPAAAPYRAVPYPLPDTRCEQRADGSWILRSARALPVPDALGYADSVPHWAERRAASPAFCERDAQGEWRRIGWAQLWRQLQHVAAALLELGLGPDRPLLLLSGNSIEQAVLLLAAEYVGVPTAPVSPAYSLADASFGRLAGVCDLLPPAALFVQDAARFAPALQALGAVGDVPVIHVHGDALGTQGLAFGELLARELTPGRQRRVAEAHAAVRPDHTARVLFTSGSTGTPKGVPLSYRNFQATAASQLSTFGVLGAGGQVPVFLDWLPWHHGMGGVLNFGRSVLLGATHYIDDGKPLPGQIERTVRNLREVSPTVFNSVPAAWMALAGELERDAALAQSLFARVHNLGYGGASLPVAAAERIQRVAERTVGERILFGTGLASTETSGIGTYRFWVDDELANIGVPQPGTEVKLVPLAGGRHEIRIRGAHVFAGYLRRPDLTAAAFDEEGFFQLGDAVRLVDAADPARGMCFDGRVAEDFKLVNGTWVRTGAVRLALVEACAPLITDAVVCGHDQPYLAALAWPHVAACQRLAPELAGLDAAALARHPVVLAALRERLRAAGTASAGEGASLRVQRLALLAEPPSLEHNEIADKGYVNQAATRARRADRVAELFALEPAAHVVSLSR